MFILNHQNSIASHFLEEIRDINLQTDRLRFRYNLERLGQILAYEISKSLDYRSKQIATPLTQTEVKSLEKQPVLISVLRAAMPFYQGFLDYFDQANSGFIGAFRKEEAGNEVEIEFNYLAAPPIQDQEIIIVDPMLATGKSLVTSIEQLLKNGTPKKIHIASVIAAPEGIDYIKSHLKEIPFQLWLCALDERLNKKAYIVPGLGDAGDLCFGPKL
ncbi:uracil phosphoribosyltransferase [Echinicola sediminis]